MALYRSSAALGLAIFLGFVKKMNTGLLCTALALLVGRLAGISDDEMIRGFNYSLFLMLLGVTYLFGLAEINGTLALLSKKIVALSGRRTYLVPIVMYLFATILSALGPGTIPTAAIMMVFGMTLAKEMNINPAMLGAIIFLGAAGGGMSPLAATGIIGLNLCGEFLTDRNIVGTCPRCGAEGAYGDQCEKCGATLSRWSSL